ncbi:MAG: pyruvate formate lyase activating enzyme [Blastocatellia bacterium]
MAAVPLKQILKARTIEGEIYEKLEGDRLRCYACGHRCLILPGLDGICRVRYNDGGRLMVPTGYVAALACDPTEKKPFFHAYPGSLALTFGMLGCDYHCSYCFTGETMVVTNRGPLSFLDVFNSAKQVEHFEDADIAYPDELEAVTASGRFRKVNAAFKHDYKGQLAVIKAYYLPELQCTPDHRVYATDDLAKAPEPIEARRLTNKHYLVMPRRFDFSSLESINVADHLRHHRITYRIPWLFSVADREAVAVATQQGKSSREIGAAIGKDPSYIRHIRSKMNRGLALEERSGEMLIEENRIRFPNEHRPGIPSDIPLNADFARLLGLYCAEGCVTTSKKRPNSNALNFSFSHTETHLVDQVRALLHKCLGIVSQTIGCPTTLAVAASKTSAALLFKALAGGRSNEKRVPEIIFNAPREIIQSFLNAYIEGDGHRYKNGKVSATTVSKQLAYGIAWLALKLGYLPSLYDTPMEETGYVENRRIKRAPHQYTVVWYEDRSMARKVVEKENYFLIPIRNVSFTEFEGSVYNMEVEEEHNYLAGFFLAKNCQNWVTSQALRDPQAIAPPRQVTAEQMVEMARRYDARLVVSSYNEPLITSEWAVEVFKQAKPAGFVCGYVSNGNATPEVLDYIRPWTELYKIDLKGFNDRNYRKLGGLLENVLNTIKLVYERGFWMEIVTLIIPGFNDSTDELRAAAEFISSVSPDIPWHVTAFHQDYKMTGPDNTSVETLIRAAEIGYAADLKFVYAGNLPGRVGRHENTYCPSCKAMLIERYGFRVLKNRLSGGACPDCQAKIPGRWD